MTTKLTALLLTAVLAVGLSGCGIPRADEPRNNLESGVSAIEDAMTRRNETSGSSVAAGSDLRNGSSDDTVATPDDFPAAYNYGSGKIEEYSRSMMLKKMPLPYGNLDSRPLSRITVSRPTRRRKARWMWQDRCGSSERMRTFTASTRMPLP